jgi:glycosyltransferase involved in cell wall biosynthesis
MSPSKKRDVLEINKIGRFAFIIPVYNHEQEVADVVTMALKFNIPVFVVDDGSTDSTYEKIKDIERINISRHNENRGKGAAIMTGLAEAVKTADWAITIDADGQHNPEDAIYMIQAIPDNMRPIVIGMREGMIKRDVPWTSRFGRKFSNFWVLLSGGPRVTDSQSGFRIYPLPESLDLKVIAKRFQFEVEILVKARWNDIPVIEAPISVIYRIGKKRISHFHPFIDFLRNSSTFTRLIVQRILIPLFIRKRL